MKTIPLTKGYFTKVDNDDYKKFAKYRWYALTDCRNNLYVRAMRSVQKNNKVYNIHLSREIMNAPKGMDVDHINGDKLDNQKSNLRICTHSENMKNRKRGKNNTSGYKGVSFHKNGNKWRAYIKINGKPKTIGYYDSSKDAAIAYAIAYNEYAKIYYGEFALLNHI